MFQRMGYVLMMSLLVASAAGCNATIQEMRGKTAFGPEFRDKGDNTNEVRYDVRQGVELRFDNGVTTGVTYRRRDIDDGSGDNENLVLFEVGYPLWKAPKKDDAVARRVADLERQVEEFRRGAGTRSDATRSPSALEAVGHEAP